MRRRTTDATSPKPGIALTIDGYPRTSSCGATAGLVDRPTSFRRANGPEICPYADDAVGPRLDRREIVAGQPLAAV